MKTWQKEIFQDITIILIILKQGIEIKGMFLSYIFFPSSTTCTTKKNFSQFLMSWKVKHVATYVCFAQEENKSGTYRILISPAVKMQSKPSC